LVDNEGRFDLLEEGIADGCLDVKVTLSNGRSVGSMDSDGNIDGSDDSVGTIDGSMDSDGNIDGSDDSDGTIDGSMDSDGNTDGVVDFDGRWEGRADMDGGIEEASEGSSEVRSKVSPMVDVSEKPLSTKDFCSCPFFSSMVSICVSKYDNKLFLLRALTSSS